MIKTKVYLYDSSQENNGYRGQDFSKYVLQGNEETEDVKQELDTAEITLSGLSVQKEFDPETKFIVDILETDVLGNDVIVSTKHWCVSRDVSTQPILSDDNYFDHHISFIEPSVVAQKRLVDNISTTYKLKDVTLKEVQAVPDTKVFLNISSSKFTPDINFGKTVEEIGSGVASATITQFLSGKYFELEGSLLFENRNGQTFNTIYNNIENFNTGNGYYANFIIPKLAIMFGVSGTKNFSKLGYASITCKINEVSLNDETVIYNSWSETFISNSNLGEDTWDTLNGWQNRIQGEWLIEKCEDYTNLGTTVEGIYCYYKKYTETSAATPSYKISNIPIRTDRKYVVTISLYQFPDNIPSVSNRDYKKYTGEQPAYYTYDQHYYQFVSGIGTFQIYIYENPTSKYLTASQTSGSGYFVTYDVDTGELVYASSTPYSALALLQKAIINSAIYEKTDGVYIADVNNSNLPFYIDSNFVDELRATSIVENFYNQKNLWEIMIEVGHYIHAIPELRFGSNDRFEITFNRLGRTDENPRNKDGKSNKVSIFNSRSIENYISATSSYVTNMVQLGGIIEEWVVPKTTNETLLVSNDTAEIIVSKPIIELLKVVVKRNSDGATADLTPFIYEENVYKTLQLDYQVDPNRGIAMYYSLGDNVITGGQFQLPQANTNPFSDYAFKKIIWCAFNSYQTAVGNPSNNYWGSILIKDYSFFVVYRTKDSVRQNHIRPDLRKYLVNSKFDKIPEHNQFNNQTDVVVDSIKFGNNIYGKLIKTGNSSYEITEWSDSYSKLKHKGELYRINGELYYVAKATHYIFSSHFISKVEYSKDYNELSSVIGIPSEPRFYEISEQSLIWREFAINDILLLTDNEEQIEYGSNFVFDFLHLASLILGTDTDFAKYALTVFKGDKDTDKYDQTVGQASLYKEVLTPINAYSSENTLTYEWDMIDNYSAGDKVVNVNDGDTNINKRAYSSLKAVGYTDIYGRSALLDFFILGNIKIPTGNGGERDLSNDEIKALPESPIKTKRTDPADTRPLVWDMEVLGTNAERTNVDYHSFGIGLLKDCREAMSINFNLQLATNSDTFVLSPYIFSPNKKNLKIVLLEEEVNKLSSGYIDNSKIITPLDKNGNAMNPKFTLTFNNGGLSRLDSISGETYYVTTKFYINLNEILKDVAEEHFVETQGYTRVKSIAIICDVSVDGGLESDVSSIPYKTQFVFARNIPNSWDKERATKTIYFGSPNKDELFKNKQ